MTVMDTLDFQPMLITDVFESMRASQSWYDKNKLRPGTGTYPYISRSAFKNGHESAIKRQDRPPNPGNAITIGVDTQTVFYQPMSFYTSVKIQVLRHPKLSPINGPILVAILRQQMSKFQWGNGASLDRLEATRIMVPVITSTNGELSVDWDGMTKLGDELTRTAQARAATIRRADPIPIDEPELDFHPTYVLEVPGRQEGIFRAHKGKRLTKANRNPGNVPFVAGSRVNNSIVDYADAPALFPGGWITLIYNGDGGTGHAKFQPVPFNAADDVIALEPISPDATEDALMLLVTLLTQQCVPKFGFGYKLTLHRLGRQRILVPMTEDPGGSMIVDWRAMDAYGKFLRQQAESRMIEALGGTR